LPERKYAGKIPKKPWGRPDSHETGRKKKKGARKEKKTITHDMRGGTVPCAVETPQEKKKRGYPTNRAKKKKPEAHFDDQILLEKLWGGEHGRKNERLSETEPL